MKLFDKSTRFRQVRQLILLLIMVPGLFYHNAALTANKFKNLRQSSNTYWSIDAM